MLACFLLLIHAISPLLVKIANPTEKLNNEEIETMTKELCQKAGVRYGQLSLLKYGNVRIANAMVSGILPCFRRIYLTDLLVEKFTPEEVQGVLAHEIAHLKKRHLLWLLGFGIVGTAVISPLAEYIGLLYGSAEIISLLTFIIYWSVLFSFCSRIFERQADRCAVELTGNPEALVSALNKLAELNFVTKKWGKWDIFQSHPDMEKRIKSIRQFAAPAWGEDRQAVGMEIIVPTQIIVPTLQRGNASMDAPASRLTSLPILNTISRGGISG